MKDLVCNHASGMRVTEESTVHFRQWASYFRWCAWCKSYALLKKYWRSLPPKEAVRLVDTPRPGTGWIIVEPVVE